MKLDKKLNNRLLSSVLLISIPLLAIMSSKSMAADVRVAVASNFTQAIMAIANKFEATSGHKLILIFGSTGKHYAQISNGAPFDVFLAADIARPERLEKEGLTLAGSRFTYAIGKVVLWSPQRGYIDPGAKILEQGTYDHLAIANPKLAPYGKAAMEILMARNLWHRLGPRLVRGENIAQTYQYVKSGSAELGFVSYSQLQRPDQSIEGSYWVVPQALYTPIQQQAVLLKDTKAGRAFMTFLRSDEAVRMIHDYKYDTP